ncbi:MAG: hypothetical protein PHD15_06775 [Clostridia bacterium]|nr:hypothetical protein [Clostridia bacterium]
MKKKSILIAIVIITIALITLAIISIFPNLILKSIFSKHITLPDITKELNKMESNCEYIFVRTKSNTSSYNGWITIYNEGSGYAINNTTNEILELNSIRSGNLAPDVEIIGKHNDYVYIYMTNEGISKIKDGKYSNIVSYPTPSNIQIKSNNLLYVSSQYDSSTEEMTYTVNLLNLDNEINTIIYQGKDYVKAKLNDNGVVAIEKLVNKNNTIEIFDNKGNYVNYVTLDSRHLVYITKDYVYYSNWGNKNYNAYNLLTKEDKEIPIKEYYCAIYGFDEGIVVNNISLSDIISNINKEDKDLYNVLFDNQDNIYFQSEDYYKICSVNKNTGEKKEVLNTYSTNEQITDIYLLLK